MLFSEFLNDRENILESLTTRIQHHTPSAIRRKQAMMRKKSSYKMKQKILARLRKRKHCPNGQSVDNDGKGCHKTKHLIGLTKKHY